MRGACAVLCALVVVCGAQLEEQTRAAAEKHLLALMGLERRPRPRASRAPVPPAMRLLYEHAAGALPRGPANTVRSFAHRPSRLDQRFPADHLFRLHFDLALVPPDERTRAAELVLQRADPHAPPGAQRLLVYDIVRPGRRGVSGPVLRLLDSVVLRAGAGAEPVAADATEAARRWLREPRANHGLLVRVLEEEAARPADAARPHVRVRRRADEDEAAWAGAQPLLLLYTEDDRARRAREGRQEAAAAARRRRAVPRRQHRPHHRRKEAREPCRRRPLFVDFADVGWSDWIVAPQGYEAFYCQGECAFPLADHLNGTNHAVVQTLVNSVNPAAVPRACCVPTQLSSVSMLYMDENNNVVLKNYQDMAVEGCGCR